MATIKDLVRLCNSQKGCVTCPIDGLSFCSGEFIMGLAKEESVIDNWCGKHPTKTYADDFFEKFPNAVYKQGRNNKYPAKCRNYFYANRKGGVRDESNCDGGCEYCWNEECDE